MVTNLKITSLEIRNSKMLKEILQDESLAKNLKKSAAYVSSFSKEINESAIKLNKMISNMENGKGVLGKLYMDTSWVNATDMFIMNLRKSSYELTNTSQSLKDMVSQMREETLNGDGVLHQILKNEEWSYQIDSILVNTKQGSDNINQLAIALQKHFLFRRYFRKMTKSEKK
jgi:phospholipid/cholesterol/gamma-HCH transport system substrate-binding protein